MATKLSALKGVKLIKKKTTTRKKMSGANASPRDSYKKCTNFFHFEVDNKECVTITKAHLKKILPKEDFRAVSKLPDWTFSRHHVAAYCWWVDQGLEADESSTEWMTNHFNEWIEKGRPLAEIEKKEAEAKKNIYVPNIQERIRDAAGEIIAEIEGVVDGFIDNPKDFKNPDMVKMLKNLNVNQAHTRHIINFYQGSLQEFNLLMNPVKLSANATEQEKDLAEQFKEGYAHLSKAEIKKGYELYRGITSACDLIVQESKATRKTRQPKQLTSTKLVSKLKYCVSDPKYKVASIKPEDIIGATELWVFNVKTRKLGIYVAEEHVTLQVKGTTLQFFDAKQSISKTLRKAEDQLREFNGASLAKKRKFIPGINGVETKLNGRMSIDTVLLKVSK